MDICELDTYSFWKLGTPSDHNELPDALPLGTTPEVLKRIGSLPEIYHWTAGPGKHKKLVSLPIVRLLWGKEGDFKITLRIKPEISPLLDKDERLVYSIDVSSTADEKDFFRLYVQLREHFGVTLFSEIRRQFIEIQEFRQWCRS